MSIEWTGFLVLTLGSCGLIWLLVVAIWRERRAEHRRRVWRRKEGE